MYKARMGGINWLFRYKFLVLSMFVIPEKTRSEGAIERHGKGKVVYACIYPAKY